jgi:hypothetical protein
MAEIEQRRPKVRRGRRGRTPVTADPGGHPDDNPGDDGSAGVREPRRPRPFGPMSGAGALPEPEVPLAAVLPDPRY